MAQIYPEMAQEGADVLQITFECNHFINPAV